MTQAVLVAGRKLTLKCGVTCTVYPVGMPQLPEFAEHLSAIMNVVTTSGKPIVGDQAAEKARRSQIVGRLLPYVLTNGLKLASKCVVFEKLGDDEVTMEQLPHWDVALIAKAWIEESIGEDAKNLEPWVALMEMVKTKGDLLSSSTPSSSSSPAATA